MVIPPPVVYVGGGCAAHFRRGFSRRYASAAGCRRRPDFMANWSYRWLRAFLGLIFCWSFRVTGPAAGTLQAQESAPAVAETVPVAIHHSLNAVLPEQAPVGG